MTEILQDLIWAMKNLKKHVEKRGRMNNIDIFKMTYLEKWK